MGSRTRFRSVLALVLAGHVAAQSGGPGAAFCHGDGTQVQCPCPGEVVFREDFDQGVLPSGWIATGLWSITEACGAPCGASPHAYFGDVAICTYTGVVQQELHRLLSPPMLLPEAPRIELTHCSLFEFEPEGDKGFVRVHGENGAMLQFVFGFFAPPQPYDLTPLAGQNVRVEFLASVSPFASWNTLGWKIDDVLVRSTHNGYLGQGCLNSTLQGGRLDATGSASISASNLILFVQKLPPSTPLLFMVSDEFQSPAPLWSGLSCLAGSPTPLTLKTSNSNGSGSTKPFETHAAFFQPAQSYAFQVWYRDSGASAPCGVDRNLTNAYSLYAQP
jgi:hypothetical protein